MVVLSVYVCKCVFAGFSNELLFFFSYWFLWMLLSVRMWISAYFCGVLVYIVAIVVVSWNINIKAYGTENTKQIFVLGTVIFSEMGTKTAVMVKSLIVCYLCDLGC